MVSHFEVLNDDLMGSDHAPIMCTLVHNKKFKNFKKRQHARFNFQKADWLTFGRALDNLTSQLDLEKVSELNEIFTKKVIEAANQSIPKLIIVCHKSYPPHIIDLINMRRGLRLDKKKLDLENRGVLNIEYNRYTNLIKSAIKVYTEEKWACFLGRLGPYPVSSSFFWRIINKARSPKKNSSIPNLLFDGKVLKSDEEKANLFRSVLGETFTESKNSSDFDMQFHKYVECF